jgi:signal transduction histidine kinase
MADVSGTFVGVDIRAALRDAMALLPRTRHVALVADAIDDMSYWRTLREDLSTLPQGVALIALEGLPVDELKQRVAALPPDSLIFYTRQIRDHNGRQYGQADILDALARSANAPVFGQVAWQMGHGVVGGRLVDPDAIGRKTAALVLRVAGGERAASIPVDRSVVYPAVYDARELRRWGIDRERLPPNSTILFEQPSLWREKRGWVIGIVTALLMQSALIGALLWERRRRRRIEIELRQRTQEIAQLNRSAALGEVSAAIAHEVNQPLGSILLNAEAAERLLAADRPAVDEAREILQDIRRDGRRAGAIIHKVRQLFRHADAEAQRVSMNRIVRDVVEIAKADFRFSGVQIDLDLAADLPRLSGDRVQLQQVTFNLMTNAADAVQAMSQGPRRIKLRTHPQQDRGRTHVLLEVIDTGAGLPADGLENVFEPFVSGKADGMGVGLSISRNIAAAHGGTLTAQNVAEGGACFRLSIPALLA